MTDIRAGPGGLADRGARPHPIAPIWSQDKDMEAADVKVYTTGELRDAIRDAGSESA